MEEILATSRNPEELKQAWLGWHNRFRRLIARTMYALLSCNKGAQEMGFKDTGRDVALEV